MTSVAERFALWSTSLTAADVPPAVLDAAALHLLDGLGCALAASGTSAEAALRVARSLGGPPEARVPGHGDLLGAAAAAFATGVLAHALDFDDTHPGGLVHATAVVLPAAFAVGQQVGATGVEVLRAAVIGYELVCRLGAASPHGFHARGLHATGVAGPLAAAAVTSALLRLDAGTTTQALGIAASSSGGLLEFLATGAATKQLHPGSASLNGVLAARLAAAGGTGPATAIEGGAGLLAALSARPGDPESVVEALGERWETPRIGIKPYPACELLHASVAAAAVLRERLGPADVASVQAEVHPDAEAIVCGPGKAAPRTPYDAKFSLPWSVAAMLLDGEVGVGTYADVARPDVAALAARVSVTVVPQPGPAAAAEGRLTITGTDGRVHRAVVPAAADATVDAVRAKFRGTAGPGSDELAERVLGLAAEPSLHAIMDLAEKGR